MRPTQTDTFCQRRWAIIALAVLVPCVAPSVAFAAGLVRVNDGTKDYEGKVVSLTPHVCSLIDRQGYLVRLNVAGLRGFEKLAPRYEPESLGEFRDKLRKEFSGNYEVSGTSHYLVCAPTGRSAKYGELFETIYRDVEKFYRVRGFEIHKPSVPLVAVVFGSQREFAEYCVRDKVPPSAGLQGYYSLRTNRVALFDDDRLLSSKNTSGTNPIGTFHSSIAAFMSTISGETANTIIHETTHQVGYNIGVHSRVGGTPVWVVEGLATVLEPDSMRRRTGRHLQADRINEERSTWFGNQHRPSRAMGSLAKLVASDAYFHQNTLDSYSEAWAFTFFLLENSSRRRDLVTYLQKLSRRNGAKSYSAKARLADFEGAFGDISRLEVEFIRFMDRM